MAAYIPHQLCGVTIRTARHDDKQIVSNAVAGEEVMLQPIGFMVQNKLYYRMKLNDEGWASFEGNADDGKTTLIRYNDLGAQRHALLAKGRVAIQDNASKKSSFVDKQMDEKTLLTLALAPKEKLSLVTLQHQRGILTSRMNSPHEVGARIFWGVRCLQHLLQLDVKDDTKQGWDKRNFRSCREQWKQWYSKACGVAPTINHFMPSQESWEGTQMQDHRVVTYRMRNKSSIPVSSTRQPLHN